MKKIRILHTSDIHLGTAFYAYGKRADILAHELLDTFLNVISAAKKYSADALVICGDITDCGILDRTEQAAVNAKFAEISGIPVFLIYGNHDMDFNGSFPDNVHVFDRPAKFSLNGADIYGASYKYRKIDFVPDNPDNINIVMRHGSLDEFPARLPKSIDYAALGHFHSYSVKGRYVYSGMPMGRGFDEQGQPGFVIADISKERTERTFVPTGARQFAEYDIDITNCAVYTEILDIIREKSLDKRNLYRFNLTGVKNCETHSGRLCAALNEEYFYVAVADKTKLPVDLESEIKKESLMGYFLKNAAAGGADDETVRLGLSALKGERIYTDEN